MLKNQPKIDLEFSSEFKLKEISEMIVLDKYKNVGMRIYYYFIVN